MSSSQGKGSSKRQLSLSPEQSKSSQPCTSSGISDVDKNSKETDSEKTSLADHISSSSTAEGSSNSEDEETSNLKLSVFDIDNKLEEKLKKHGLNRRNVKTIIHELLNDERVRGILKANLDEDESANIDPNLPEPKNLRSKCRKAEEETEKVEKFTEIPLPEDDDDDEEYDPNILENSQDTIYSSQDTPASNHDLDTSVECLSIAKGQSPQKVIESADSKFLRDLSQCEDELKAIHEMSLLEKANKEKEIIALRTRSKHSLLDTAIAEIETAFNPPDVEDGMYTPSGDQDWHQWLAELMLDDTVLKNPEVIEDDQEQDPDYNFIQSETEDGNEKEENRTDHGTRIPRREVEELLQSSNEPPAFEFPANKTKHSPRKTSKQAYQRTIFLPKLPRNAKVREHIKVMKLQKSLDIVDDPSGVDSPLPPPQQQAPTPMESSVVPLSPPSYQISQKLFFSPHQTTMLKLQLRQYVQLLTQTNLLHRNIPSFSTMVHESHALLKELQQLNEHDKKTMKITESYFNVPHLSEAISIVEQPVEESGPITQKSKATQKRGHSAIQQNVGNIIATSPVFAFSQLLPTVAPVSTDGDPVRVAFTKAEDNFLVLGLAQMQGHLVSWPELVHRYMMPCKAPDQIRTHVRNSSHRMEADNPIRLYKENGMLPSTPPLFPPDIGPNKQVQNLLHFLSPNLPEWLQILQKQAGIHQPEAKDDNKVTPVARSSHDTPVVSSVPATSSSSLVLQNLTQTPQSTTVNTQVLPMTNQVLPSNYTGATVIQQQRQPSTFTVVSPIKQMSILLPVIQPIFQPASSMRKTTTLISKEVLPSPARKTKQLIQSIKSTFPSSKQAKKKKHSVSQRGKNATGRTKKRKLEEEEKIGSTRTIKVTYSSDAQTALDSLYNPTDEVAPVQVPTSTTSSIAEASNSQETLSTSQPNVTPSIAQQSGDLNRKGESPHAEPAVRDVPPSQSRESVFHEKPRDEPPTNKIRLQHSCEPSPENTVSKSPNLKASIEKQKESRVPKSTRASQSPSSRNHKAANDSRTLKSPIPTASVPPSNEETVSPAKSSSLQGDAESFPVEKEDIVPDGEEDDDMEDDIILTEDDDEEDIDMNEVGDDLSEEDIVDEEKSWQKKGKRKRDLKVKWKKRKTGDSKRLGGRLHRVHPSLTGKRRPKSTEDNISESLRQSAERVKMLEEETIVQLDPGRSEKEMLFAKGYLKRIEEALSDYPSILMEVLEVMCKFDMDSAQSPPALFRKLSKILHPWPELIQGFAPFLMPEQAHQCGLLPQQQVYAKARKFLRQLEIRFQGNQQHLTKILNVFREVAETGIYNEQGLKSTILSLLKSDPYLQEEFLIFFEDEHPPESRLHGDYEEVTWNYDLIKDSSSSHFEYARIPSFGIQNNAAAATEGQTDPLPSSPSSQPLSKLVRTQSTVGVDTEDEDAAANGQRDQPQTTWAEDQHHSADTEEEQPEACNRREEETRKELLPELGLISEDALSCSPFKRHTTSLADTATRPATPTSSSNHVDEASLPFFPVGSDLSSQGSLLPVTPTGSKSSTPSILTQESSSKDENLPGNTAVKSKLFDYLEIPSSTRHEVQARPQALNFEDEKAAKPWTREDDASLLGVCKEHGATEEAFKKTAESSGRTIAEVQTRFEKLMSILARAEQTDTDTTSHYTDSDGSDGL